MFLTWQKESNQNTNKIDTQMLKIQIQLESLKDEMNKMIITDQSGISDKLSYIRQLN